ncbi:MAG TPA: nicotinate-nucleotide adenylyltransferase [Dehalococcoidia bacterium]|nr:nicotinate-nucleotide adenylyltransferase [Dehalococcoidia bacterium]
MLGGTFDPIHIAHLVLAEQAREQLKLDRVLFIPAGDPWRKAHRHVSAARHRVEMVRLAIEDNPAFELDEREVRRQGPTYTVDTLHELRRDYPLDELFLLLGEDALADLPFWRDPEGIAAAARIVVAPRAGVAPSELPFDSGRIVHIDMPRLEISSTDLRARASTGRSLRYLVPSSVEAYIRENRLYV